MPRRLQAPSIDHMSGQAAGLAFLPGVTQGASLDFDAFPVFVVGCMKDVSKGSATVQREGLSKSRRVSNVRHSGMTLRGQQADVPIDRRHIIVVQAAKLHMDCEPRLGIPKKESQDFVRCPAEGLQVAVDVLKESIVVPAKAGVLAVAEQVDQALTCQQFLSASPAAYANCFIIVSWPWLTAPKSQEVGQKGGFHLWPKMWTAGLASLKAMMW